MSHPSVKSILPSRCSTARARLPGLLAVEYDINVRSIATNIWESSSNPIVKASICTNVAGWIMEVNAIEFIVRITGIVFRKV